MWATGRNNYGQLGDGTTSDSNSSVQVLDADGNVLNGVIAVSAGSYHSIYLKRDGTVWAVGYNSSGQLGDGTNTNRTTPVQVLDADGNVLNGVIAVSAGSAHTVFLKSNGTVWATGQNDNGELGDGTTTGSNKSVQVLDADGNELSGIVKISAGTFHTAYLKSDGTVLASGKNNYAQLGDSTWSNRTRAVQVKDTDGSELTGVVDVSVAGFHSLYLKSDGTAWGVGNNSIGRLGDGTTSNSNVPVQVTSAVSSPFGAVGLKETAGGRHHTIYLRSDGTVWAVGKNDYGQLGDGLTTDSNIPVQVMAESGVGLSNVISVSANLSLGIFKK